MSAAHALVSLGVMPPSGPGKGKTKAAATTVHAETVHAAQKNDRKKAAPATPVSRRESPLPAGPSDESDSLRTMRGVEDQDTSAAAASISKDAQMEIDASSESAVSVLTSFSMGLLRARFPSPAADDAGNASEDEGERAADCAQVSIGRLEQLALFALQSLAAMEPIREMSPSQLSEDSQLSLDTPRTVVDCSRGGEDYSRSKMAIDQLMTSTSMPPTMPSSPVQFDVAASHLSLMVTRYTQEM